VYHHHHHRIHLSLYNKQKYNKAKILSKHRNGLPDKPTAHQAGLPDDSFTVINMTVENRTLQLGPYNFVDAGCWCITLAVHCSDCWRRLTALLNRPPRKLRCCGALLLRNFRVFVQARNFCHGAQLSRNFGSLSLILRCFCGFLPFWRHFGAKWNMEPLSTHNLYEICSCLSENCDFLTPYFFTVNATVLEWLD